LIFREVGLFKKYLFGLVSAQLALFLIGCGNEGPLGNTPPQGRPEWMKKKEAAPAEPAPAEAPQKQP